MTAAGSPTSAEAGPRPVSGVQFHLSGGGYRAQVGQVAAVLRGVHFGDQPLTETWPDEWVAPMGCGIMLAPWPNRIAGGRWQHDGQDQQLDITEPAKGNAIHGLLRNAVYQVVDQAADFVELGSSIYPQHGYPFTLDVSVRFAVSETGLTVTQRVTNVGRGRAPFGVGAHPYLRAGATPAADLTVTVRAATQVVADATTQIPTDRVPAGTQGPDLSGGARVGDLSIDMGFTDLDLTDGLVQHHVSAPDGKTTVLWADPDYRWAHVFTPRIFPGPGLPDQRSAVAIEPMTCPANAFNNGWGLKHLDPGETWSGSWGLRAEGF